MADKNRFASNTLVGGVQSVSTGITGVAAKKCGHVVTLYVAVTSITASGEGWYTIGTLPQEIRPSMMLRYAVFDNAATSYKTNTAIPIEISKSGVLQAYFFSDKLKAQPQGALTYLVD